MTLQGLAAARPNSTPPQLETNGAARIPISDSIRSRQDIMQRISTLRDVDETSRTRGAYQLAPEAHALSMPTSPGLHHTRSAELNQLKYFYAGIETEKKCGPDSMTDTPIAGALQTNPHLRAQHQSTRLMLGEAATATVDHYQTITRGTEHYIRQLHNHLISQLDPHFLQNGGKIHLVRPTRSHYAQDATLNYLTLCTQADIAASLNHTEQAHAKLNHRPAIAFTDYKTCVVQSRTAQAEASPSPIERLVQQAYFTCDEIAQGDKVVITNDHAQTGASILAMAAALKAAGAELLGVTTLTAHPHCRAGFTLDKEIAAHLHDVLAQWDPEGKVLAVLREVGLNLDTLTNAEALILIAYATDPTADATQQNRFAACRNLEQRLTQGIPVLDGEHDALDPILKQKPLPPEALVEALRTHLAKTRTTLSPTPLRRVEVLDWDCLIANEKEMLYKLSINALFAAAHNHKTSHPALQQIAHALKPYLDGQGYQTDMPTLCMGKERFIQHAIADPYFWKKPVFANLLAQLHVIAPHIQIPMQEKKQIFHILKAECARQYHTLIRPPAPPALASRQKHFYTSRERDLEAPFQDLRLTFMPGAKNLLDKLRKPDALLALISNKGDCELQNEVNTLGIAHYFDSISGISQITRDGQFMRTLAKPSPHRLFDVVEKHSLHHRNVPFRLWGDQNKDITQAVDILTKG
ncbi:MAG: HAD hydrolase-like protein, partial [Gammaproteobacteria bacterium]